MTATLVRPQELAGVRVQPDATTAIPDVVVADARPPSPARTPGWRTLAVVAAVALLAVEAVDVGSAMSGAITSVLGARPGWLVLAMGAAAASMSMFARSRRRLLRAAGVHVPVRSSVAAAYVANALHMTLPGGAAFSTAYTYRWMRRWNASAPAATWTLAGGGLVASAALAGMALLGSVLVGGGAGLTSLVPAIAAVLAVALGVRHLAGSPEAALALGDRVMRWMNKLRRRPPGTGADAVAEMVTQLRSVRPSGGDWLVAFALAAANWAFDAACLAASAAALGVHGLSLGLVLLAHTAGMAASSLSVLPAGLGVVDAALLLTLVGGGIPASSALPAVLLYRLISLVGVVAVGWVVMAVQAWKPVGRVPVGRCETGARPEPELRAGTRGVHRSGAVVT